MAMRAASAYCLWLGENRASLVKAHGLEGKPSSEVIRKAGEVWKVMDPASKAEYQKRALSDKQRYEEEVQVVGKRVRRPMVDTSTGKKVRKDECAPKQPLSAFFMWVQDSRENAKKQRPGHVKATDFSYEAWKAHVSEVVKKKYKEKAVAAREQYKKDLDLYHLQRASCRDSGTHLYNHWNVSQTASSQSDAKVMDICECGEPLNGVRFCKQCGEENPQHKDASKSLCTVGNGADLPDKTSMCLGQTGGITDNKTVENGDKAVGARFLDQDMVNNPQNLDNPKPRFLEDLLEVPSVNQPAAVVKLDASVCDDEEAVTGKQLATKEEILCLASSLEKVENLWLRERMACIARAMPSRS